VAGLAEGAQWYATLIVVTWGLAPVSRWLCGRFPDRGAAISRPVALLVMLWPTWFLASVSSVPFTTRGLWITLFAGAALSWPVAWRSGWVRWDWLRALVISEAVALAAFVAYCALRGYTPQITWTEKPMDVAFLSASARATDVPPPDPWYAGEPINYYYLGYFLHGSLARMAHVPSWIAFNLALATTVSMTLTAAAGLGFSAARLRAGRGAALTAAAAASFFLVLAGNLKAPIELLRHGWAIVQQNWWTKIGWESSRIVVDPPPRAAETINEFPWFSFLLGDLHPHVTALPFTVVALALAVNLLRRQEPERGSQGAGASWTGDLGRLVLTGAIIGALYPLNSWDFPTYLAIAAGAIVLSAGWTRASWRRVSVLVISAVVAWLPFTVSFAPFAGGDVSDLPKPLQDLPVVSRVLTTVAAYDSERTSTGEFLTVFGIFWAIATVFLAVQVAREARGSVVRVPRSAIVAAIATVLVAVLLPAPVLVLAGAPLVAAGWSAQREGRGWSPILGRAAPATGGRCRTVPRARRTARY
jgi:YYY domain-containing protein